MAKKLKEEAMPEDRMMKGFLQATKYLNSHLNPGEQPIYRAHLSWIPCFIHQIPFMLLGGLIGGIVWGVSTDFMLGLAIFVGAWVLGILSQLPQCYKNISTDILITNQGIHSKRKLVAVEDDQFTRYGYVNDAELNYGSVFQRMFQYGNIKISTVSGSDDDYEFKNLAKPMSFKNALRAAQARFGNNAGMMNQPYTGMPPQQQMPQQQMPPQEMPRQNQRGDAPGMGMGIPTRHP